MRLLLLNPNTSEAMTRRMTAVAVQAAAPGTSIRAVTASRGIPYISGRAEAQIGGAVLLEMLAEHRPDADAAIVAAFGDPGLIAARELFDIPVVGLAEAAMLSACMLGARFSIVTFAPSLRAWFADCVAMHGLGDRCASIRTLDAVPAGDVANVQDEARVQDLIVELAADAVRLDGAEVIIPAGAPLSGLAAAIRDRVPVPVVDQVVAAVKQAEALVALKVLPARAGGLRRPDAKANFGLSPALTEWIAHEERPAAPPRHGFGGGS